MKLKEKIFPKLLSIDNKLNETFNFLLSWIIIFGGIPCMYFKACPWDSSVSDIMKLNGIFRDERGIFQPLSLWLSHLVHEGGSHRDLIKGLNNNCQTSKIVQIGINKNISWGDKESASVRCWPFFTQYLPLNRSAISSIWEFIFWN